MKNFSLIAIIISTIFANLAQANNKNVASPNAYVQTCSSWSYNSEARGYVCNSVSYTDLAEAGQVQRDMQYLQNQIQDLKSRIQQLEQNQGAKNE